MGLRRLEMSLNSVGRRRFLTAVPASLLPTFPVAPGVWYRADAGLLQSAGGVPAGNGQAVGQWLDQSGNGRHAAQGTSNLRPLVAAGAQNGLPGVSFDGTSGQYLDATVPSQSQPTTFILAANVTTVAGTRGIFDSPTSRQAQGYSGGSHLMFAGSILTIGTGNTGPQILTYVFNGASSLARRNGVQIGTGDPGANALQDLRIGNNSVPNAPFWGNVYEVLFFPSSLSAANLPFFEAYLNARWRLY